MAAEITGMTKTPLSDNKIDNSKAASSNTIGNKNQNTEHTKTIVNTITPAPIDKITLTQQAEELRMIEKNINNQTDFDDERVETLRLEIDAGRYDIDAQRIAEKLIAFEMMFVA